MGTIEKGSEAYIIENGYRIRKVTVLDERGGLCTLRLYDGGGTRLHKSRLYRTMEEAQNYIEARKGMRNNRAPHRYGNDKK